MSQSRFDASGGIKKDLNAYKAENANNVTWASVKNFGAKGDGVTDDTIAFQNAINSINNNVAYVSNGGLGGIVVIPKGSYVIGKIFVPPNVSIYGNDSVLINSVGDYMISLNGNGGNTDWVAPYPNYPKNTISNLHIRNKNNVVDAKGIFFLSGSVIKNIKFDSQYESIGSINKYVDNRTIENIIITNPKNPAQITLNQGDGLCINNVSGSYTLKLTYCDGTIDNCVGGSVDSTLSKVQIRNWHTEKGTYVGHGSMDELTNCVFWKQLGTIPITLLKYDDTYATGAYVLKNIQINLMLFLYDYTSRETDISLEENYVDVVFENVFANSVFTNSGHMGHLLSSPKCNVDIPSETFIDGRYILSNVTKVISNNIIPEYSDSWLRSDLILTAVVAGMSYKGELGTYYYRTCILDDIIRMVGFPQATTQPDITVAISDLASVIKLYPHTTRMKFCRGKTFRIYKGNAQNSYNQYCDLKLLGSINQMFDNGDYISGIGYWVDRAAGVLDAILKVTYYEQIGDNVIVKASALPTIGTWAKGDKIINTNPVAGGYEGWICVTAGTPGIWKGYGLIQA